MVFGILHGQSVRTFVSHGLNGNSPRELRCRGRLRCCFWEAYSAAFALAHWIPNSPNLCLAGERKIRWKRTPPAVDEDPVWLDVCITKTWINWIMDGHGWSWIWNTNASVSLGTKNKTAPRSWNLPWKIFRHELFCAALREWGNDRCILKGERSMGWEILWKGNFCQLIPPKPFHEHFVESLHNCLDGSDDTNLSSIFGIYYGVLSGFIVFMEDPEPTDPATLWGWVSWALWLHRWPKCWRGIWIWPSLFAEKGR